MDAKGAGAVPLSVVAALAGGAAVAPGLPAQEVDSVPDAAEKEGLRLGVLVGVRGELFPVPSPGASADLVLDLPELPIWVSLQLMAQTVRWNVQYDAVTRRDTHRLLRVRLGYGKRQGLVYALFEKGRGVVRKDPGCCPGDTYDVAGIGLGGGTSFGRFTASLEAVLGGATRGDHGPYIRFGPQLQYRVPLPSWGNR